MCKSIINGVQRVLDFACSASSPRVLFLSSGASYGGEHPEDCPIPEEWVGSPIDVLDIKRAYTETKRASEMLCTVYRHQRNLDIVIARCFLLSARACPWTRITRLEISLVICWLAETSLSEGMAWRSARIFIRRI